MLVTDTVSCCDKPTWKRLFAGTVLATKIFMSKLLWQKIVSVNVNLFSESYSNAVRLQTPRPYLQFEALQFGP